MLLLVLALLSPNFSSSLAAPTSQCTIIGGSGRIGSLLASAAPSTTTLINSKTPTPYDCPPGPIYVATRNDVLSSVISNTPSDRHSDLVFLQNGYIEPFLKQSLPSVPFPQITQALLFFAVTSLGADPIDGVTPVSPNGLTAVTGKWSDDLAARCSALNLKCNVVPDEEEFRKQMFEKLIWIATLQLVGDAQNEKSVGDAQSNHQPLVETVIEEQAAGLAERLGVNLSPGYTERLLAYTDVVAMFPPKVKEFEWRNEIFFNFGDELMPTHNMLLRRVGAVPSKRVTFDVKLPLPPLGIVFEEIVPGGREGVVVTGFTSGGAAERDGRIRVGDILQTTTAVKIEGGTSKANLVEVDCSELDFDTVVSAISSHQAKFKCDAVEMTFARLESE